MSDVTPPAPETFVDDDERYRLDSRIATGGMGEVWRATDTQLGRTVAIKLLKTEYADDATFRSRFVTEARHAASLIHPGVASVYDFGEAEATDGSGMPRPFLVMELVDGQPLSNLLRDGQALDPEAVRDLLAQAGEAIGAAHRAGIVHRDVKPANLMVTPERQIKITDFGIARASDGLGLTGTGQVMGTPQYLSPEQARGQTATPASDVYSLGVVGFECLAGHRPFDAESPIATALAHLNDPVPDLPTTVPTDLAVVVYRALSKKPEDRYADGAAFAAAVRDPAAAFSETEVVAMPPAVEATEVLAGPPPVVPVPVDPTPTPADAVPVAYAGAHAEERRRRSPWALVLALAALALLAGGVTWALTTTNDNDDDPDQPDTAQAVKIDPKDYIGRDIDVVTQELERLGLEVERNEKTNPGERKPGGVTGLKPTKGLVEGDTITVTFWGDAAEPSESPSETQSQEPTQEPSNSPEPSDGPSTTTSAPTTAPPTSAPPSSSAPPSPPTSAPPTSSAAPPPPTTTPPTSTAPASSSGSPTTSASAVQGRP